MIKGLCEKFVERSKALGLKGKARDAAAVHFFCGAASALSVMVAEDSACKDAEAKAINDALRVEANKLAQWVTYMLQYRGYAAVALEVAA